MPFFEYVNLCDGWRPQWGLRQSASKEELCQELCEYYRTLPISIKMIEPKKFDLTADFLGAEYISPFGRGRARMSNYWKLVDFLWAAWWRARMILCWWTLRKYKKILFEAAEKDRKIQEARIIPEPDEAAYETSARKPTALANVAKRN